MLLVESNVWLYADYTTRMVAFIASLLTTTVFFAHLIGVLTKLYKGLVLHSINLLTVFNILSIYTLILELGSVAPAIHIFFFEALAFSPFSIFNPNWGSWLPQDDHWDHEDDDDDHDDHDDHDDDDHEDEKDDDKRENLLLSIFDSEEG